MFMDVKFVDRDESFVMLFLVSYLVIFQGLFYIVFLSLFDESEKLFFNGLVIL